jgi:hypothetical protein
MQPHRAAAGCYRLCNPSSVPFHGMASYSTTNKAAQPVKLVICGGGASAVLLLAALKEESARPMK